MVIFSQNWHSVGTFFNLQFQNRKKVFLNLLCLVSIFNRDTSELDVYSSEYIVFNAESCCKHIKGYIIQPYVCIEYKLKSTAQQPTNRGAHPYTHTPTHSHTLMLSETHTNSPTLARTNFTLFILRTE